MPVIVVDASAVAAILFGESSADSVVKQLGADALAAPSLLPYELANVAAHKMQRNELSLEAATIALRAYPSLQVVLYDTDLSEVVRIGLRARLTAYDATYLWLARSLSADLVTLDGRMVKAWAKLRT